VCSGGRIKEKGEVGGGFEGWRTLREWDGYLREGVRVR
jgi:hypothetical protein